jgi:hypothetical protein
MSVTHFAQADFRNVQRVFGIKDDDRFSHVYVIGKTGTRKSTLLETMALQDVRRGAGLALIDPHGDLVERIASQIPDWRQPDVVYLNASDPLQPFGYNPLRHVRADRISLAASGFLEVFKKMWPDAWAFAWSTFYAMSFWRFWSNPMRQCMTFSGCSLTNNSEPRSQNP